jgi:hypothetical protein
MLYPTVHKKTRLQYCAVNYHMFGSVYLTYFSDENQDCFNRQEQFVH